jgi:hypothetical protein
LQHPPVGDLEACYFLTNTLLSICKSGAAINKWRVMDGDGACTIFAASLKVACAEILSSCASYTLPFRLRPNGFNAGMDFISFGKYPPA